MHYFVRRLSNSEFAALCPQFVDIYLHAMDYPEHMRQPRTTAWIRALYQPGFCAIGAFAAPEGGADGTEEGHAEGLEVPVGVAYGYIGTHLDWWHTHVRLGLIEAADPKAPLSLLNDYFELAEVHVDPGHQGQGLGRELVTLLAECAPAKRMMLSTPEVKGEDNLAFHLYRSLGFVDVLRDFVFPGDSRPFAILSAPLPLPGA